MPYFINDIVPTFANIDAQRAESVRRVQDEYANLANSVAMPNERSTIRSTNNDRFDKTFREMSNGYNSAGMGTGAVSASSNDALLDFSVNEITSSAAWGANVRYAQTANSMIGTLIDMMG